MAKFNKGPLVQTEADTWIMGAEGAPLTEADRGKALTIIGHNRLGLADADDEIYGFLSSLEPGQWDVLPTGKGFAGGVQKTDFHAVDTASLAAGTRVVVDSNPAIGTEGKTVVKAATAATTFTWVVVRPGLIERV